jgi:hypothetical protein
MKKRGPQRRTRRIRKYKKVFASPGNETPVATCVTYKFQYLCLLPMQCKLNLCIDMDMSYTRVLHIKVAYRTLHK